MRFNLAVKLTVSTQLTLILDGDVTESGGDLDLHNAGLAVSIYKSSNWEA